MPPNKHPTQHQVKIAAPTRSLSIKPWVDLQNLHGSFTTSMPYIKIWFLYWTGGWAPSKAGIYWLFIPGWTIEIGCPL